MNYKVSFVEMFASITKALPIQDGHHDLIKLLYLSQFYRY